MDTVHMIVGTLVVIAFIALTVVYALEARGRAVAVTRQLSGAAGGLLLLQYGLGFILLGGDRDVSSWHYLFAVGTILTMGLEHGKAMSEQDPTRRFRIATVAAAGTTTLALIAYAIGQSTS